MTYEELANLEERQLELKERLSRHVFNMPLDSNKEKVAKLMEETFAIFERKCDHLQWQISVLQAKMNHLLPDRSDDI